ncbi:2Fe-2S iron-sulfur cluster-binding protein [Mesorhizobium sp. ASY16-5R]|uniref:2Fe-2S iron-sulfur cluster-binding protein n=1 Tax=Mesorhizobium sp. ASY16-5R TaxID=3445772 RepID=UPI003F9F137E
MRESAVIASFYLEPADGQPLMPFSPGQFLTFSIEGVSPGGTIWRNYSLSGSPHWSDRYRISVKREPASAPTYGPGLSSNYLHDDVNVGDLLWARGPEGRFMLDLQSSRPVVLLSGGVGLTPLVAMAHALARQGERKVRFIHACESGEVHALGDEIRRLATTGLSTHFCYRNPRADDALGRDFDTHGIVTRELLQSLLPLDDYEFYLCGPSGFMQGVFGHLLSLGVRDERIRYEFFGPATVLRAQPPLVTKASSKTAEKSGSSSDSAARLIRFADTGVTISWDESFDCLLDFAEAQGLNPAFSCRAGICSTCMCDLREGQVDYPIEPLEMPPEGKVLICCAKPRGDVVLGL